MKQIARIEIKVEDISKKIYDSLTHSLPYEGEYDIKHPESLKTILASFISLNYSIKSKLYDAKIHYKIVPFQKIIIEVFIP